MKLYIANKNYSSWSLRAWLILNKLNVKHEEVLLKLFTPEFYSALEGVSDTLKVPVLVDEEITVHESLAIGEYISETYCNGLGWPTNTAQRAKARALASEMASSFSALRNALPMNIRAKRQVNIDKEVEKDIARIDTIFQLANKNNGGWLFGQWSIADAMFAPVVLRFQTYDIRLSESAQAYCNKVMACDVLNKWIDDALLEKDIVPQDETGIERN